MSARCWAIFLLILLLGVVGYSVLRPRELASHPSPPMDRAPNEEPWGVQIVLLPPPEEVPDDVGTSPPDCLVQTQADTTDQIREGLERALDGLYRK